MQEDHQTKWYQQLERNTLHNKSLNLQESEITEKLKNQLACPENRMNIEQLINNFQNTLTDDIFKKLPNTYITHWQSCYFTHQGREKWNEGGEIRQFIFLLFI